MKDIYLSVSLFVVGIFALAFSLATSWSNNNLVASLLSQTTHTVAITSVVTSVLFQTQTVTIPTATSFYLTVTQPTLPPVTKTKFKTDTVTSTITTSTTQSVTLPTATSILVTITDPHTDPPTTITQTTTASASEETTTGSSKRRTHTITKTEEGGVVIIHGTYTSTYEGTLGAGTPVTAPPSRITETVQGPNIIIHGTGDVRTDTGLHPPPPPGHPTGTELDVGSFGPSVESIRPFLGHND